MHALVQIDALRFTPMTLVSAEGLELAYGSARRAVELAPDSGRAHLALAMALFFRGEVEQSLAAGEVAARLSPHDPDIRSEEHTSELQSLMRISYAVFCLKKKNNKHNARNAMINARGI